jgi:8-oxo-dGTP diphosphatase
MAPIAAQQGALSALFTPAPGATPTPGQLCPGRLVAPGLSPLPGHWGLRPRGGAVLAPSPSAPEGAVLPWADRLLAEGDALTLLLETPSPALLKALGHRGFLPRAGRPLQPGRLSLACDPRPPLAAPSLSASFPGAQLATLLFACKGDAVLLMEKKRGHGAGLINGPGGKLEAGESLRACALREAEEELGIRGEAPRLCAELRFEDQDGSRMHGFVYRCEAFQGTPRESGEGKPLWVSRDAVPYGRMWADDRAWLPWVLRGHGLRASFATAGARLLAGHLAVDEAPEQGVPAALAG